MNRQIKFRSYKEGRMTYNLESIWCGSSHRLGYTYMQFTGLYDKNGKEIYEGDIIEDDYGIGLVKFLNTNECDDFLDTRDGYYDYASSGFYCLDKEGKHFNGFEYGEIIGNIFETPNLLTK